MLGALLDAEFLTRLGSIVVIDLLLAGDNALVIALAVRSLPKRQQLVGRILGTVGAVVLRVALIMIATALLRTPLLQFVGGLVLLWIAVKLARPATMEASHGRRGTSLRSAIGIVIVADLAMSLDNVLGVAAAAHGDLRLIVFGIALSIPIVVWGSGLLARLMARFTWIVWVGGGVLGYVAGEMMVGDQAVGRWISGAAGLDRVLAPALGLLIVGTGWWFGRERRGRVREDSVASR